MRIFIYPSDIQVLTGKSIQNARYMYKYLKDALSLKEHDLLTIQAYCDYYKLDVNYITELVNASPVKHSHRKYKEGKKEYNSRKKDNNENKE